MSKSKKKKKSPQAAIPAAVNTLGIDIEPAEEPADTQLPEETEVFLEEDIFSLYDMPEEDYTLPGEDSFPIIEKIISYSTIALSMLLLGGSIVFWWVIGRLLLTDPTGLADSELMRGVFICCAVFPVIITVAQALLRRPVTVERWLICLCLSGAAAAMVMVFCQMVIRGLYLDMSGYFTLLCCTVSGCTLPSALCAGTRWLIPVVSAKIRAARANSPTVDAEWDDVSGDVCSMTDFDL